MHPSHYHNCFEIFITPKRNPIPPNSPPDINIHLIYFFLYRFVMFWTFHINGVIKRLLLFSIMFSRFSDVIKCYQYFVSSYCLYSFIRPWSFELLLLFGYMNNAMLKVVSISIICETDTNSHEV